MRVCYDRASRTPVSGLFYVRLGHLGFALPLSPAGWCRLPAGGQRDCLALARAGQSGLAGMSLARHSGSLPRIPQPHGPQRAR